MILDGDKALLLPGTGLLVKGSHMSIAVAQGVSQAWIERHVRYSQNRDRFNSINTMYGLFNSFNGHFESIGFDDDGNLCRFTEDGSSRVSLAESVKIIHRMERDWFSDDKPMDHNQDDDAVLKWWGMLEKELQPQPVAK